MGGQGCTLEERRWMQGVWKWPGSSLFYNYLISYKLTLSQSSLIPLYGNQPPPSKPFCLKSFTTLYHFSLKEWSHQASSMDSSFGGEQGTFKPQHVVLISVCNTVPTIQCIRYFVNVLSPHNCILFYIFPQIKKVVEELEDRPELQHVVSVSLLCPFNSAADKAPVHWWGSAQAENLSQRTLLRLEL